MTSPTTGTDTHPAAHLRFELDRAPRATSRWWPWRRRASTLRGIRIMDHTGAPVAVVFDHAENAATIAHLFVTSPALLYGVSRARSHLRQIAQAKADPQGEETHAVRQLLREIHDAIGRP